MKLNPMMNNFGMGINNMGMGMNNIGMGMGINNMGMGMGMNNMDMGVNNMNMMNNPNMNMMNMPNMNMMNNPNMNMMNNPNMNMMNNPNMNMMNMPNMNMMNMPNMNMMNMPNMNMMNMPNMNMNNMNQNNNNISPLMNMFMMPAVNNINNIDNRIGGNVPKDLIPRSDKFSKADFYNNINEKEKLNILIQASTGMTVLLPSPPYISIAQLFKNYVKKIHLPETVLEKSITFIFEANVVNPFDPNPIYSKFKDNSRITVIDTQNVISA